MAILSKADFLRRTEEKSEVRQVEVPGWGTACVRMLSAKERDAFDASNVEFKKDGSSKPKLDNYRGRLAAVVICDEAGNRLFDDDNARQLGDLPGKQLDVICTAARDLNGMADRSVEEAEKNCEPTPDDSSSSGSPAT